MINTNFIYQRICIFAGLNFDPMADDQVKSLLRSKFNIRLPQRLSMNESLESSNSNHEIVHLILQFRSAMQ